MKKIPVYRNIIAAVSIISFITLLFTGAADALPKDNPGAPSVGESCGRYPAVFDAETKAGGSAVEETYYTVAIGGGISFEHREDPAQAVRKDILRRRHSGAQGGISIE